MDHEASGPGKGPGHQMTRGPMDQGTNGLGDLIRITFFCPVLIVFIDPVFSSVDPLLVFSFDLYRGPS